MSRDPRKPAMGRRLLARMMAGVLIAGSLTVLHGVAIPAQAKADGPRQPRSSNSGLVAPEIATDLIPANIVIGPQPGEDFPASTVVGVQMVPMTKILRNGSIDQDHALAEWIFSIRYPRSPVFWPPWLPEPPNTPWRWHFYEMPDGEIIGIGPEPGSPLYTPPLGLPADWLQRLIPAARAAIPQSTWNAATNVNVEDVDNTGAGLDAPPGEPIACEAAFGLDNEEPCEEAERVGQAFADAGVAPPAPANPGVPPAPLPGGNALSQVALLCTETFLQTEACLAAIAIGGAIISKVLDKRRVTDMHSLVPCFGQTAEVIGWMAVAEGLLIAAAFKPSNAAVGVFAALALVAFGWGIYQFVEQIRVCGELIRLSTFSGLWAPYVAAAAALALVISAAAIIAVAYTALRNIDAVRQWWGGGAH